MAKVSTRRRCCAASATGSSTATTGSALDRAERRLHPAPVAHRCRLPARDRWPRSPPEPCGGSSAATSSRSSRRHDHRGRRAPVRRPTPYGSIFSRFAHLDLGLALRSTPRAVPLIVLSLAVLLGAGTRALASGARPWASWPRSPRSPSRSSTCRRCSPARCWPTTCSGPRTSRRTGSTTRTTCSQRATRARVLELPGADFASYRWGNTVDPITPGLMDRPYVARELIPYGSAPSADLLNALDRRLQEGWYEPSSLAPVAALMGVGEINVRSDLQYERYRTPRPRNLWADIEATPGLGAPTEFGDAVPNRAIPELPLIDEVALGTPPDAADPPPVAAFPVERTRDIVRAENADRRDAHGGRRRGHRRRCSRGDHRRGPAGALLGVVRERPRGHAARARRRRPPRADRHEPPAGAAVGNGPRERRRHRASRREGAGRRPHRQPARASSPARATTP